MPVPTTHYGLDGSHVARAILGEYRLCGQVQHDANREHNGAQGW